MMCSNCSTLAFQSDNKKCINCKMHIFINLMQICDTCSSRELICSICLKKVFTNQTIKNGCRSCGKK